MVDYGEELGEVELAVDNDGTFRLEHIYAGCAPIRSTGNHP